jgi:hypothetical protein
MKRASAEFVDEFLLKRRRIEGRRPQRILSYTSKSHAFQLADSQNRIECGKDFFFPLVDMPFKSTAFKGNAPSDDADENTAHHRYFLMETAKLVATAGGAKIKINQQIYWTKSGQWLKLDDGTAAGVEPDFCTTDVVDERALVRKFSKGVQAPLSKYDVALAFEQKKKFVETDLIEAVDYGERLLCIQRGRLLVYTALFHCCDGEKMIRWLETREVDGKFVTRVSRPESLMPGCPGQQQLFTVLTKTSTELGLIFPKVKASDSDDMVSINSIVGEGATSTVYAARFREETGILKLMKSGFENLADHEQQILTQLKQHKVVGVPSSFTMVSRGALFFGETLQHISKLTALHTKGLIKCLEEAHTAGVVHRDLCPDNVMEASDGTARLIDWGFAYVIGSPELPFQGTFRYASDEVLDSAITGQRRQPQAKDDLESFVRMVLSLSAMSPIQDDLARMKPGDFKAAKEYWLEKRTKNPDYEHIFIAAETVNYEPLTCIGFT